MPQERVNWVAERSQCATSRLALISLAQIVEQDVKERNQTLQEEGKAYRYHVLKNSSPLSQFRVVRGSDNPNDTAPSSLIATFEEEEDGIRVQPPRATTFHVTMFWCATDHACRYFIDDTEAVQLWEISRRALESLFFELA